MMHPVQRVDVLRYMILYVYGGMYMDMDIECWKGLDAFLEEFYADPKHQDQVCIPKSHLPALCAIDLNNYLLISPKGHPFWKALLEEWTLRLKKASVYDKYWDILESFANEHIYKILYQSGPKLVTDVYRKHKEWVYPLPKYRFNPKHCYFRSCDVYHPQTLLVHNCDRSWITMNNVVFQDYTTLIYALIGTVVVVGVVLIIIRVYST
jgi:mannosyltransferase OCH1-like enzyme